MIEARGKIIGVFEDLDIDVFAQLFLGIGHNHA